MNGNNLRWNNFWKSNESKIFLSPHLAPTETSRYQQLAQKFSCINHIWILSSGSTRSRFESAKLVALNKEAILSSAEAVNRHLESNSNDRWVQVLPEFHVGGLGIEARAYSSGAEVYNGLNQTKWDPRFFHQVCSKEKITLGSLVPTQVYDLVQKNLRSPPSVRALIVGGSALSTEMYKKARELGWPLLPSFGMTETASQIATAPLNSLQTPEYPRLKVLSHLEVDHSGEGVLKVRGSSLLTGFGQFKSDEVIWTDPKDSSGWLTTEDKVEITQPFLKPLGRGSDFIKIFGEGVSLGQLKEILSQQMIVCSLSPNESTILVQEDSRKGSELVVVFQSSVSPVEQNKVLQGFNSLVRPYERIKRVVVVDKIPRSDLGKPLHSQLSF